MLQSRSLAWFFAVFFFGGVFPVLPEVLSADARASAECKALTLPSKILSGLPVSGWTAMSMERLLPFTGSEAEGFADAIDWPWKNPKQLRELAGKFIHFRSAGRFSLELELANDSGDAYGYVAHPNLQLVGVLTDGRTGKIGASIELNFYRGLDGKVEAELKGVYADLDNAAVAGLGESLVFFLKRQVFPPLRVSRLRGIADYSGRYVWASVLDGIQLSLKDWNDTAWVFTDDEKQPQNTWQATMAGFSRFLSINGIPLGDLYLPASGRTPAKPIRRIQDIAGVAELVRLRSRSGRQVAVRPLLRIEKGDVAILGRLVQLDPGKAFALKSYVAVDGEPSIESHWGQKFNRDSMPPYSFAVKLD